MTLPDPKDDLRIRIRVLNGSIAMKPLVLWPGIIAVVSWWQNVAPSWDPVKKSVHIISVYQVAQDEPTSKHRPGEIDANLWHDYAADTWGDSSHPSSQEDVYKFNTYKSVPNSLVLQGFFGVKISWLVIGWGSYLLLRISRLHCCTVHCFTVGLVYALVRTKMHERLCLLKSELEECGEKNLRICIAVSHSLIF